MDNFVQKDKEEELSGSETFAKYWYQYNWALIKFLEESRINSACSLSIECHEDVMIIDKDDPSTSKVELYQVKERSKSANLTASALAYSSDSVNTKSIISKLVKNLNKPHLENRIKRLALVSATPFNLKLNSDLKSEDLASFSWENLSESDSDILFNSLKNELGLDEVPIFIEFIKGIEGYTEEVHSSMAFKKLSEYIEDLLPNMAHKPKIVFELLRSELIKIGTNTTRYTLWSDFKSNKTLSASEINEMINKRSIPISSNLFGDLWRDIKKEKCIASMSFSDLKKLKSDAKYYHEQRLVSTESIYVDIANVVSNVISDCDFDCYEDYVEHMVGILNENVLIREYFDFSIEKIKAAVVVELSECL
jgi:hypothetical protein